MSDDVHMIELGPERSKVSFLCDQPSQNCKPTNLTKHVDVESNLLYSLLCPTGFVLILPLVLYLVAMYSPSEARTTTHHNFPPYYVWTALVLAVDTSKGYTSAPSKELQKLPPNHLHPYQDIGHG